MEVCTGLLPVACVGQGWGTSGQGPDEAGSTPGFLAFSIPTLGYFLNFSDLSPRLQNGKDYGVFPAGFFPP